MHHYLSVTSWDRSVSGHAKAKFKFGSPFGEGISVVSGVQPSREIKNIKNNVQSAYYTKSFDVYDVPWTADVCV